MFACLFCFLWFSWRIYDLHSRANPTYYTGSKSITNAYLANGTANPDCYHNASTGYARLEPQVTNALTLGFALDWSYDTPTTISNKLNGYTPLVFNAFMELLVDVQFDFSMLNWYGSECGRVGSLLELTLMPASVPLTSYTRDLLDTVSAALYTINSEYGVPILLRFGHEMNGAGPWNSYAFDPTNYIPLFQMMAESVYAHTNMTAMVWAPNIGFGYPFGTSGATALPTANSTNFALLDTNGDGVINKFDDPYGPYYPGDDYVDWVGVSLYFYPPDENINYDIVPGYFDAYLTGYGYNQLDTDVWWQKYYNFYKRFCGPDGHNKPMLLPETGAPYLYLPTANGNLVPGASASNTSNAVSAITIRTEWFASLFNTTVLSIYPKIKLVVNFEEEKYLSNYWRDWRLTNATDQRAAFIKQISDFGTDRLPQASKFSYGCSGTVSLA
ncbi:hypothetical protein HDU83_000313 [Entophlyctis luteolus]|nr:hypothetical protein HDU83_000313 [Entophlyctis luteolus]